MSSKLVRGNEFHFGKEHGFSGSCGGTTVKGYMRGGHVKHSKHFAKNDGAKVPQRTAAPLKHHGTPAKATVHHHASTPHAFARGGSIRPSDKEHRDYKEWNEPRDEAVYPEVGHKGKPSGYRHGGKVYHQHKSNGHKAHHASHHHAHKGGKHHNMHMHVHHHKKGGEVQESVGPYPHERLKDPGFSELYEAAKKGGPIRRAKGGEIRAARVPLKAPRMETKHHKASPRLEHMTHHEHHGKARKSGHGSTPHAYAQGGLSRPMPGPVMGAKHRMKTNPMVSAVKSPLAMAAPQMPQMGGMGLKRGGKAR